MLKIIALVVVDLLVALLVYAATKSDTFLVQRSASINAPPEKIFPLLNDFHSWSVWSPYEKLDPEMKRTYSGSPNGKGARYEWESSGKAGVGRMEISNTAPPSQVSLTLDLVKPFETHNVVDFTLQPMGGSTNVTWAMRGRSPYLAKVMHVFFDMDSIVGKDFEAGLVNLKGIAEQSAAAAMTLRPASTR
ncbi:MAG: SRPBCC family protein [Nitrospiraceae bacterium]